MEEEQIREEILNLAIHQLNKTYEHGMHGPLSYDCAGLIWYIYDEIMHINLYKDGYGLSTTTMIMTSSYGKITYFKETCLNKNIKLIKQGDILLFHRQSLKENEPKEDNKYPGHCGLYLGEKKFIHCTKKDNVHINILNNDSYWYKKLVASKNIFTK